MILLTGASGFIGKHLLSSLISNFGIENVVSFTSKPIPGYKYILHENFNIVDHNFSNIEFEKIEIIIHAGAFTPKNNIESNNINLNNSNIYNTEKLLNFPFPNLKKFIYLSTLDVYGDDKIVSEDTTELPVSLYGYSKLYSEKMVFFWGKEKNITTQILRIGHVYGPGEEAYQKIIPSTILKVLKGEKISIWGSGKELRAYIHVCDVVQAITNSIKLETDVGVINITGEYSISINDLVTKIISFSDNDILTEHLGTNKNDRNLIFNNFKLKKYLLNKEVNFELGLKEEFEYMRKKMI
jgi:UDP-glucose 4-epimerase